MPLCYEAITQMGTEESRAARDQNALSVEPTHKMLTRGVKNWTLGADTVLQTRCRARKFTGDFPLATRRSAHPHARFTCDIKFLQNCWVTALQRCR